MRVTRRLLLTIVLGAACETADKAPGHPDAEPSGDHAQRVFHLIAHRGAHPYYYGESRIDRRTGCSATLMRETEPHLIENTIPAVAAAFQAGATAIEIDVHRSSDNHLVVFHDADLACRTNGRGAPEAHTLAELKSLDVGFGYTSDGRTFPLRGDGAGLLPTLREMLDAFPDRVFVLDDKAGSAALIAELLADYPPARQALVSYWGSASGYEVIRSRAPSVGWRLMTRSGMLACRNALLRRLNIGALPAPCRGATLILPASTLRRWYVRVGLGWPDRFLRKAHRSGTSVIVSTDSLDEAVMLRKAGVDGIMTDRIGHVGRLAASTRR